MGLRLDTKLSHLLIDEGVLRIEALEDAVQQQVVHGGALDTLLLELHLVTEDVVTDGLSRAWDTTAPSEAERNDPDALAVTRLPSRMATAMGLCPYRLDEQGLHVMVAAPIDQELLNEVGGLSGFDLVPHVIPEVRLHEALHRAYGIGLDERYLTLLRRLNHGDAVEPRPALFEENTEVRPPDASAERNADADRADISPAAAASWDIVEALAHLAAQDRREGIAQVAVSFALRFVPFAAVFGIRAGNAVGWHRGGPCEGNQFHTVQIKVPDGSVAGQVLASPSPLIGKPPIHEGNTVFLTWLGRRRPRTALLIPIVVARRTVGILYADGGVRARDIQSLSDLVAFGARIGPAFEALLRARHRAHADLFPPRPTPAPTPLPRRKIGSGALDGTSPFARNYTGPIASPPSDTGVRFDDDGMRQLGAAPPPTPDVGRSPVSTIEGDSIETVSGSPVLAAGEFIDVEDTLNAPATSPRPIEDEVRSDEGRAEDDRSDEEKVSWAGVLDADSGIGETLDDTARARLGAEDSPGDTLHDALDPEKPRRKRRAPLLFDDRTEPLTLKQQPHAEVFSEESAAGSVDDDSDAPTGVPAELVFPEYPRQSTGGDAWTGALEDTVARGLQGGPPPQGSHSVDDDLEDLATFGLPPVEPAPPLPDAMLLTPLASDADESLLSPPPVLLDDGAPVASSLETPLPLFAELGPNDDVHFDDDAADSIAPPALPALPEVAAMTDSTPPKSSAGAFAALIESALPQDALDDAAKGDDVDAEKTSAAESPVSSPAPDLDDAIELHTGDVDVSHHLTVDGPYLDDVVINDPPVVDAQNPPRAVAPAIPDAGMDLDADEDDPNATQEIGSANATDAELVEDLGSLQPQRVNDAKQMLLARGASAREAITARFPGKLLVDVLAENLGPREPAEIGPLVDVTIGLGKEGVLCAAPHLRSEYPAFRFAAAYVLLVLGDERNLDLLPPLLTDPEARVRHLATDGLIPFLAHPRFEQVLGRLRPLLLDPTPARRAIGAAALGRFKDVASVPALIALVDDKTEGVRHAAVASLTEISVQDLGPKAKAWKKWWEKARKVSRIDWLIDGLKSGNRSLRRQAVLELQSLTGDDFGYRVDDTKRQREAVAAKFEAWWTPHRPSK